METLGNKLGAKKGKKGQPEYYCEKCDLLCYKKYSWERHLLTTKHKQETNGNALETNKGQKGCNICCDNCDKEFKTRSGLWKHTKNCNFEDKTYITNEPCCIETTIEKNTITDKELIMMVVKQNTEIMKENSEMKNMMMKVIENGTHNTTNNNNTNSHNKTFNLNFFLNETCKNAMNIMDFVNQLQLEIKELEDTGRLGFAEGISKIIINGLKQMDISDRPIHCSDSKREVVYIKDNDQWNKESEDKTLLTTAIKHVAHKNMKKISQWTKANPEFNDSSSKQNDKYLRIVSESMSGSSQEETKKNYNKIIKNIAKETIIDK